MKTRREFLVGCGAVALGGVAAKVGIEAAATGRVMPSMWEAMHGNPWNNVAVLDACELTKITALEMFRKQDQSLLHGSGRRTK